MRKLVKNIWTKLLELVLKHPLNGSVGSLNNSLKNIINIYKEEWFFMMILIRSFQIYEYAIELVNE